MVWLKFAACLAIILFAGTKLAHYGDAIAERTGLGRLWVGLLLLAAITSMPEMVTGLGAIGLVGQPDLAMGNLLGSNMFNLTILSILDIMSRRHPILSRTSSGHLASAVFGIVLVGIVGLGIRGVAGLEAPAALGVNAPGIIPLMVYVFGVWWIYRAERRRAAAAGPVLEDESGLTRRTLYLRFGLVAAAVIGAGIWLSLIGDEMAVTYGWGASFVGSLFLAVTTSLPEVVVSVAALRLGAVDMAVANVLGSNMFNMALVSLMDIAYRPAPILGVIDEAHAFTALLSVIMTVVVMVGLRLRQRRKTFGVVSWQAVALIGLYIWGMRQVFVTGLN